MRQRAPRAGCAASPFGPEKIKCCTNASHFGIEAWQFLNRLPASWQRGRLVYWVRMSYRASYNFRGGETVGSEIGSEHFGTNYLFHHDKVDVNGTFPQVVDRVGVDLIRYPGGTITEEFFDLANPTASVQSSTFGRADRAVTPIQEFLQFIGQTGSEAVIVLPTYRYFDQVTRQIDPAAEAIIKTFIRSALSGDYGDAAIGGFEIGNEWYQTRFGWSAAEFGELQSTIALWIDEVLHEQADWQGVGVYIQAGRGDDDDNGINDNKELAAQFTQEEQDAVDGLISHFYATTSSGDPLSLEGNGIKRRLNEIAKHWDTTSQDGLDLVVTEWNVGGDGPDNTSVTGLMRNVVLLNVFSIMLEKGVDLSAIWTAQAPGPAGLSNKEGDDHLTSTGYLYRMMRRELVDTKAVDMTQSDKIRAANGDHIGRTHVFEGDGKTVIYLASGVGRRIDLDVDLGSYMTGDAHIHATVLGTAPGHGATDYRTVAQMTAIGDRVLGHSGNYTFNLRAYEVVQIVITRGTGVDLFGDDEIATHDRFDGSAHDDAIWGFDGNDELRGFDGDDQLDGGAGDDLIFGGDGDDSITGGDGNDQITGGDGNDVLDYSSSDAGVRIYAREGIAEEDGTGDIDRFSGIENFIGSDFDDTIFTDSKTASVESGAGDDFVRILGGDDVTVDTGSGDDFVLAEFGTGDIQLGDGNDRLLSFASAVNVDGGSGEDVIHGGSKNDTINGGAGNDTLSGGDGEDTFVFAANAGRDVILDFDTAQDMIDFTDFGAAFDDIGIVSTADGIELQIAGQSIVELHAVAVQDITSDLFNL